jgi:hypothetical protein
VCLVLFWNQRFQKEVQAMSKDVQMTFRVESDLREQFSAAAANQNLPAAQVLRELMRGYIEQQQQIRDYNEYLRRKVEAGRASMRAGRGESNDEVESEFAARRDRVLADQA